MSIRRANIAEVDLDGLDKPPIIIEPRIMIAQNNATPDFGFLKITPSPKIIDQILDNPNPDNVEALIKKNNLTYGEVILMLECRNKPERDVSALSEQYLKRIKDFKIYYKKLSKFSPQDKRNFVLEVHKKMVARNKKEEIDDTGSLFDTVSIWKIKDIEPYFKAAVISSYMYKNLRSTYWEAKQLSDWITDKAADCNINATIMIDLGNSIGLELKPVILEEHVLLYIAGTSPQDVYLEANTGIFQNANHYPQIVAEKEAVVCQKQLDILCPAIEENASFDYAKYINPDKNKNEKIRYGIIGLKNYSRICLEINSSSSIGIKYGIYIAYIENNLDSLEKIVKNCQSSYSIKYAQLKMERNVSYFDKITVKINPEYKEKNEIKMLVQQKKRGQEFMVRFKELLDKRY